VQVFPRLPCFCCAVRFCSLAGGGSHGLGLDGGCAQIQQLVFQRGLLGVCALPQDELASGVRVYGCAGCGGVAAVGCAVDVAVAKT